MREGGIWRSHFFVIRGFQFGIRYLPVFIFCLNLARFMCTTQCFPNWVSYFKLLTSNSQNTQIILNYVLKINRENHYKNFAISFLFIAHNLLKAGKHGKIAALTSIDFKLYAFEQLIGFKSVLLWWPHCNKLMRLVSPNRIDVVESNLKSEIDRQIMSIQISMIKIESTITISI